MNKMHQFFLHILLPTFIGTCIYIGWRSTDLLVFQWIEYCGLQSLIIRPIISLPEWLLYSLPDGCWVYAITSWMILIWGRYTVWTWIGIILAVGTEYGQLLRLVPGSYQTLDIIYYISAFILARTLNKGESNEKASLVHRGPACDGLLGIW